MRFFSFLSLLVFLVTFLSCSTTEKDLPSPSEIDKDKVLKPEEDNKFVPWKKAQLLIEEGESWGAVYSPDGKLVRLVSSARSQKGHSDIYEIDLATSDVTRLTFHSSLTEGPVFVSEGEKHLGLIYQSSTDELKERPQLFESFNGESKSAIELPHLDEFASHEIYFRPSKKANSQRLTQNPGFDGQASVRPGDEKTFAYASLQGGQLDILQSSLDQTSMKGTTVLVAGPHHEVFPTYSPKGDQLFWIEIQSQPLQSFLYVSEADGKNPQIVHTFEGVAAYPAWHPTEKRILFSGRKNGSSKFSIFALDLGTKCSKEILESEASLLHPSVAQDKAHILLTIVQETKKQAYQIPFKDAEVECP